MKISRVWAVYFSPTGNVKEVTNLIAKKLSEELSVPLEQWDFTLPDNRKSAKAFEKEDLVVFGTPVYAGRVPNKILPWVQQGFTGDHTPMVPVVVFGNRNFDDALMELKQELEKNGFLAAAGAAVASSHVFSDKIAPGRPDASDRAEILTFAGKTAQKIAETDILHTGLQVAGNDPIGASHIRSTYIWRRLQVAGNDPIGAYYTPLGTDGKPAKFLKAKPITEISKCNGCGRCSEVCPMGSVDREDVSQVTGICIKCQACIKSCPNGAKYFADEAFLSHVRMLEEHYTDRAENHFFTL